MAGAYVYRIASGYMICVLCVSDGEEGERQRGIGEAEWGRFEVENSTHSRFR